MRGWNCEIHGRSSHFRPLSRPLDDQPQTTTIVRQDGNYIVLRHNFGELIHERH
jgi:hypothetical protein